MGDRFKKFAPEPRAEIRNNPDKTLAYLSTAELAASPAPSLPEDAERVVEAHKLLLWAADSFDAHAKISDGHPEEISAYEQSAKMYRECADRLIASPTDADAAVVPTHRHKKRGTEYVLIGYGKMQTAAWKEPVANTTTGSVPVDLHSVAIYRSVDDGSWWVRPREEFEDGRFEPLTAAKAGEDGRHG